MIFGKKATQPAFGFQAKGEPQATTPPAMIPDDVPDGIKKSVYSIIETLNSGQFIIAKASMPDGSVHWMFSAIMPDEKGEPVVMMLAELMNLDEHVRDENPVQVPMTWPFKEGQA